VHSFLIEIEYRDYFIEKKLFVKTFLKKEKLNKKRNKKLKREKLKHLNNKIP